MTDAIDPKERKLLGDILALVVGEHDGQSASALTRLRRRAQADRVTGGALKSLFDTLLTDRPAAQAPPASGAETARLSQALGQMKLRLAGLETELAMERGVAARHAAARRKAFVLLAAALPVGLAAGLGGGFLAGRIQRARQSLILVDPTVSRPVAASTGGPAAVATPPPQPVDAAVLPAEVRADIAEHLRVCRLAPHPAAGAPAFSVRVEMDVDDRGIAHLVRVAPVPPSLAAEPAYRPFAEAVGKTLVSPDCAKLPLPGYLLGQVRTVTFRFTP